MILDTRTTEIERKVLTVAKNKLEKNNYFPKVMDNLEYQLRLLAIKSELTPKVASFYMEIATLGKFEKDLGRGLASGPITFGHL